MQIKCDWKCKGFKLQTDRRMRHAEEERIWDNDVLSKGGIRWLFRPEGLKLLFLSVREWS